MQWLIPGTVLSMEQQEAEFAQRQFEAMFLAGGMVLSQVSSVTGLESYAVQNWVKRGFLPPPEKKRYNMNQLCRIILINMLKGVMPMESICSLISYVNGSLSDHSDDLIDDSRLYFMFVSLAAKLGENLSPADWDRQIEKQLRSYQEPAPGARDRVEKVLRILLTAWASARLQDKASAMLRELD